MRLRCWRRCVSGFLFIFPWTYVGGAAGADYGLVRNTAALSSAAAAQASNATLTVCDDVAEPATLDPQKEFSEKNHTIVQQIFDGLIRFSPEGRIEPALAVSWERLSPLIMQFRLRSNVVFHDGEPFDAAAVKFSIEHYLDPHTGFPALGFISSLDHAVIVDSGTVNIVTKYPDGLLLNRLAGFVEMVPPRYVGENGAEILRTHPVGTGAFRFKSWKKGESVELEANPQYWEPGLPAVRRLVFRFLTPEEQVRGLLAGTVDLVTDVPGTQTLRIQASKTARIMKSPTLYTIAATFNISTGPLRDVRVRQALNYAISKEELIRYDLLGNGRPIRSLMLQGYAGADQPLGLNPYEYDLDKARKLLSEGGVGRDLRLRVLEVKATRAAKMIAAFWRRAGVRTEIVSTTDARITEDIHRGPWDMMIGSCPDPMHHPYFIQSIFLYSKSPFSLTQDAPLDSLIEDMAQELDPREQERKSGRLAEYVNQNALTLFTYQRIRTYGIKKDLLFQPYLSGMPYFRSVRFIESDAH